MIYRKGIVGSVMVIVAAGIFSAFSPNYTFLIILGCCLGFGVGGGQVFSLWYLEFVPTQNRGKWMILYSSFWTFGSVIEASLGWVSNKKTNELEQTLFANCLSQFLSSNYCFLCSLCFLQDCDAEIRLEMANCFHYSAINISTLFFYFPT